MDGIYSDRLEYDGCVIFCAFVKSRILKIWKILAPLLVVIEDVHVPQLICLRSSHYANQRQPEWLLIFF